MIKTRRYKFNSGMREQFLSHTDSRSFYTCVKNLLNSEESEKWDVRSLYPGEKDREVAENLAAYFTDEYLS